MDFALNVPSKVQFNDFQGKVWRRIWKIVFFVFHLIIVRCLKVLRNFRYAAQILGISLEPLIT